MFKISIVIPVYNDGDSLSDCLAAIKKLDSKPYEVIVVDNNSTDHSARVAASYPWVKLIKEPKQGVVHARDCGFNAVKGDIIARIDADTILSKDWIAKVCQIMNDDKQLVAVSGSPDYYDFLFPRQLNYLDRIVRSYLEARLKDRVFLHGSNMAIRKSAWDMVKRNLCITAGIHEDMDLAIHLQEEGFKVGYDKSLVAGISTRRLGNGFKEFVDYSLVSPRTYSYHGLKCQRHMYPIIFLVWAAYAPAHIAFLSYSSEQGNFSWRNIKENKVITPRIDPTINVF
jgi:glycosyltransferase involved in cell wall biosynthesis